MVYSMCCVAYKQMCIMCVCMYVSVCHVCMPMCVYGGHAQETLLLTSWLSHPVSLEFVPLLWREWLRILGSGFQSYFLKVMPLGEGGGNWALGFGKG